MSAVLEESLYLRPLMDNDLPELMQIENRAYPFPWTIGIFRDCLTAGYSCYILEQGIQGEFIGYGIMSYVIDECHLLNITVRPELQGKGYGRLLLELLMAEARQASAKTIFLEVRPSNSPAVNLYLSSGFNEIGVRPSYYPAKKGREDAMLFAKELYLY